MGYDMWQHPSTDEPPRITVPNGAASPREAMLLPAQDMQRCLLDAQRQVHRLEAILHHLVSVISCDSVVPFGAVALFEESNRRLERELYEFHLDSLALAAIVCPAQRPEANRATLTS